MQTFLPYEDFRESMRCLDAKRLGKQRVETKQILLALGVDVGEHRGNSQSRWRHHPAVCMWRGHEAMLADYGMASCEVWRQRGFKDTLFGQFAASLQVLLDSDAGLDGEDPWWLGYGEFHASHRSNLLRKDAAYYSLHGWGEPHDLPYFWPTEHESEVSA